jgi:PEP-CTERM motif-containing protein
MNYGRAFFPALVTGAAALLLVGSAGAATLTGQAGLGLYYFPDVATPYLNQTFASLDTFVIGSGEEEEVTIEHVTTFKIDFGADDLSVLINTVLESPTFNDTPFNGLIFTSPGFLGLASATVDAATTLGYFDDSRVALDGDQLRLNFSGLDYSDGDLVKLDFTGKAGAVPEPGTWAMMLLGFGAAGSALRRRRRVPGTSQALQA